MSTQSVVCDVCGQQGRWQHIVQLPPFDVVECQCCGVQSVKPAPQASDLASAYQSFDAGVLARESFEEYVACATSILRRERQWLKEPQGQGGTTFLDYGCGGGHFVKAAVDLGMRAIGLEIDQVSVEFGASRGLDIRRGDLPGSAEVFAPASFDFVRSMHVLEHVPRPFEVLNSLLALLRPGGLLVVGVPDQGSFPARLKIGLRGLGVKRGEWGYVQPPIHLHGFSETTLAELGRLLNLEAINIARASPLDKSAFPSSGSYWSKLTVHKYVYQVGRALGSGGHLLAVYRKRASCNV